MEPSTHSFAAVLLLPLLVLLVLPLHMQFIASSPSLFPEEYVLEFQKCLDRTDPVPFSTIRGIIQQELKGRSIESIFSYINPEPLASASVAQVCVGGGGVEVSGGRGGRGVWVGGGSEALVSGKWLGRGGEGGGHQRDCADPVPFSTIRGIIQQELKGRSVESNVSYTNPESLASASVAQVGGGVLVTGRSETVVERGRGCAQSVRDWVGHCIIHGVMS
jgi:hypothetical protein